MGWFMLKKSVLTLIIVIFFIIFFSMEITFSQEDGYDLFVNGKRLNVRSINKDGIIYLPVQVMAGALRMNYEWDSKQNRIKLNEKEVNAVPYILTGIIYLPVESIAQTINGALKIDSNGKKILMDIPVIAVEQVNNVIEKASTPIKVADTVRIPKVTDKINAVNQVQNNINETTSAVNQVFSPYPVEQNQQQKSPSGTKYETYSEPNTNQYPGAYPRVNEKNPKLEPLIQPMNARIQMPSNLQLPPSGPHYFGNIEPPQPQLDFYSKGMSPATGTFNPKKEQNKIFSVEVTNIEEVYVMKDYYRPTAGNKYAVVYVSQQNISNQVQIYTGKFSLVDEENKVYDYNEGLSNFWLVVLRPGAINFGYLVYEIPEGVRLNKLVLHSLNQEPLSVKLY